MRDIGGDIRKAVDKHYAEASLATPHREHLGASIIGNACDRQIWYSFRWARKVAHTGRVVRLFSRGHHEEPRFIAQLRTIGATVSEIDPATGKQWRFEALGGHFAGSGDGVVGGLEAYGLAGSGVLECKTHNDKSFKKLQTSGVLTAKPVHYAQMQIYMHYLGLAWALYVAVNKNDDELYMEVVRAAPAVSEHLIHRAEIIIAHQTPPKRISESPAWWECKWCDFYDICHHGHSMEPNCRTCIMSSPTREGGWRCGRFNATIPPDFAQAGCKDWDEIR